MCAVELIDDPADPRLDDYRRLKERSLARETGRFVAESEMVVRKLLRSGLRVHSLLLTEPRLRALGSVLPPHVPVYLVPQPVMDRIAGFHVHRGCLAVGERPSFAALPSNARTVVVIEDLVDVDNLGAICRNAAAFGADALILSPRCADPFYRKAIRVSVGTVFELPVIRLARWPQDLLALRDEHRLVLVGAVLAPGAIPLPRFRRPERVALLLGSEGPGLSAAARDACDALVTIPMSPGADSLNVATAGAVLLYELTRVVPA